MRSHRADRASRRVLALAFVALAAVAGCAPNGSVGSGYDPAGASMERRVIANVNFDFDSARIRPDSYAVLDNTAMAMGDPRLNGLRFDVNGHTDVVGRLGYNVALSTLRAQAVVDYLASRGVPLFRMHPQGFGPLQLLDSYNPSSPTNRRVEIVATP